MILLTKTDEWSNHAGRLAKIVFGDDLVWLRGNVGDPIPKMPEGDIISFLSPWIVPFSILEGRLAINFHPGSSNYPGIGCYNFALYERSQMYGAVCHYMLPNVDTGEIIKEVSFPVFERDTVESLKFRTMVSMLGMFHEIICKVANRKPLAIAGINWKRRPHTRKQLDKLYRDFPNTRATRYPDAA